MVNILYYIRFYLLALTLVAAFFLFPGVKRALEVDNSLTVWFLKDDPALLAYQDFQEKFGNDEVVVAMVHNPTTLLTSASIKKLIHLTRALAAHPAVAQIISPGNVQTAGNSFLNANLTPLLTENSHPAQIKESLTNAPLLRSQVFSENYQTARFLIILKTTPDFDAQRGDILKSIRATVDQYFPPSQTYFGGVGIIYAGLNALSQQDFGYFLGIGYLVMFLLFWWIYRKFLVLLYAVSIVTMATYLTLGIYGTLGYRLNLMTILLPVLIILLGIMDAMHVLNEQSQLANTGLNKKENALEALTAVLKPCLFTTLTTMAGFLALLSSPMAILKNFGLFAALGIFLCLFFTYLWGVLLLPKVVPAYKTTTFTSARLVRLLNLVLSKKIIFGSISLALILFFSLGILFLKTDTYTLGYLPEDHEVVQDHESMQMLWGPYMPLELLVQPRKNLALNQADFIQATQHFADSAQSLTVVGQVFGYHSLYQIGLEPIYRNKKLPYWQSQSLLNSAQKQLLAEHPALYQQFIHTRSNTGRLTVFGSMVSAQGLNSKLDSLLHIANSTLGHLADVKPAGYQPMYAGIVNYVATSQVRSLLFSFVTIWLLVWVFIRNLKLATLTVIPNLFPVLVMLGFMGWLGIYLDTATASIAAVVLSFCVDDSIHFIYNYRKNRLAGLAPAEARVNTISHVGPAIVLTSLVLFFGYFFMLFGSLKTVQYWGLLTAIAIAAALFGELIIFPLILRKFDR